MEPHTSPQVRIVVGIDGTERGDDALALARALAQNDEPILLATVPDWRKLEAERWLTEAAAKHSDALLETRTFPARHPAHGLREAAETTSAEVVVVGSTHRGWLGRILPGSVGERLLHDAPCAVAIAPRGVALSPRERLRTIAVAYDTSPESEAAFQFAAELAERAGAALRILTVAETHLAGHSGPVSAGAYRDVARSKHERMQAVLGQLDDLLGRLPRGLRVETWLLDGDPAHRLLSETEGDIDLLVLGSRGYGAAARALMGSVLDTVIRSASCAVAVVPRRDAVTDEHDAVATELTGAA